MAYIAFLLMVILVSSSSEIDCSSEAYLRFYFTREYACHMLLITDMIQRPFYIVCINFIMRGRKSSDQTALCLTFSMILHITSPVAKDM